MELKKYLGKKVSITDTDGQRIFGTVTDYVFPEDNEPEEESMIVDTLDGVALEFYEKDIAAIEII